MVHKWRVGGAAAGAALALAAWLAVASAQEPPPPPAPLAEWPLARGRVELGGLAGGGFNIDWQPEPVNQFSLFLRAGYVFLEQEALVPGSLEVVAEPGYLAVFEGKTAQVASLAALLKYNLRTGTRLVPFVEGGGGVSYASERVPQQPGGTHFNFVLEAGAGVHYLLGDRTALTAEWRFHHFSNGDLQPPNPSLNSSLFLIGVSIFR
jgi:opacity protein-like surface antigen